MPAIPLFQVLDKNPMRSNQYRSGHADLELPGCAEVQYCLGMMAVRAFHQRNQAA